MNSTSAFLSVCMATYNGSLYVEKQLKTILCQIGQHDQIVVVDDCSSDDTFNIISGFNDSRIHLYSNDFNMGAQRSFEKAIGLASGDIIFLSDQDDIWYPEKVAKFSEVFASFPDVSMVLSDARIIDNKGNVIMESFFRKRGGFLPGLVANLFKNRYLGCVMAFRRSLLDKILPFPISIPQHDMWIGLANEVYGKAYYIAEPLIGYRRHENNASSASSFKRANLFKMLKWRCVLLISLILRMLQIAFRGASSWFFG